MATRFDVVGGPSKFDFMLALFDGDSGNRRTVGFRLAGTASNIIEVVINEISREDGSGDRWLFRGWRGGVSIRFNVSGYYSTQARKGWIENTNP